MLPQEIIRHKRNKQKLSKEEIDFFIKGVASWSVSECQIAALTMAIYLNGMEKDEVVNLTKAMTHSGSVIRWAEKDLGGPVLDKHSTGGVGDKVSLMLAPMVAACGGFVPMISGRGLGHTGGTLDKFDSIPGYNTTPDLDVFSKVTKEVGCAIIGQTADLAPADKRVYAVRDVTATVESIPLITASILSKKLSAGLDSLVMDLKVGTGAFMDNMEDARALAHSIVKVAAGAGLPTNAIITDMNEVLGDNAGNAVEVVEAVDYLTGKYRDPRLHEVTMALCAELLILGRLVSSREEAHKKLQEVLDNGKAAELFQKMVFNLGGPIDFVSNPEKHLPKANVIKPIFSEKEGFISAVDTRGVGLAVITLGGGRVHPEQTLNYSVGFTKIAHIGDRVGKDMPLAIVHADDEAVINDVSSQLSKAFTISDSKPEKQKVIYETITE
ncbi:MAG: thymidine phosphorylase [Alphaproteobacteria bacterium]